MTGLQRLCCLAPSTEYSTRSMRGADVSVGARFASPLQPLVIDELAYHRHRLDQLSRIRDHPLDRLVSRWRLVQQRLRVAVEPRPARHLCLELRDVQLLAR